MRDSPAVLALRRSSGSLFTWAGHRSIRNGVFQQGQGLAYLLRHDTPLNEAISSWRFSRKTKGMGAVSALPDVIPALCPYVIASLHILCVGNMYSCYSVHN